MEITTCIICEEPYFEFHNFNCPQCKTDNILEEEEINEEDLDIYSNLL